MRLEHTCEPGFSMIGVTAPTAFGVGTEAVTSRCCVRNGTPRPISSATSSNTPATIATRPLRIETRHSQCQAAELQRERDCDQAGGDERAPPPAGAACTDPPRHTVDRIERNDV